MRKLKESQEFCFKILFKSPLIIAAIDSAAINVGGINSMMAKDPITEVPFIPPSSLRGKLRALYEWTINDPDKKSSYYFGQDSVQLDSEPFIPSIINIKEIKLLTNLKQNLFITKCENTISKLTVEAKPRVLEPAREGLEFLCTLLINIYDGQDELAEDVINKVIIPLLRALEDDYIGGCGTRGFGEVEIKIKEKPDSTEWKKISEDTEISLNETKPAQETIPIEIDYTCKELKEEIVYLETQLFSDFTIQSTTIAGLFAHALANLSKDDLIENIYNGDDFLVSSAFPCIKIAASDPIHFFPRPLEYCEGIKTHDNKKKYFDSFEYISESLLDDFFKKGESFLLTICKGLIDQNEIKNNHQQILNSESKSSAEESSPLFVILKNKLLVSKDEFENIKDLKIFEALDLMHVPIDPETGSYRIDPKNKDKGLLYSTHDYFFSEHFQLFFLIRHRFKDLEPILDEIKKFGIGRDKSSGLGYFKIKNEEKTFFTDPVKENGNRYFTLSLVHPNKDDREEIAHNKNSNSYKVRTRKGKREVNAFPAGARFRVEKDKIFMFKEGSIFGFEIKGSAPVVYPKPVVNPKYGEKIYEIKDFGYAYRIKF